jgi:hypothetical protein
LHPGLAARIRSHLFIERGDLRIERVDHRERDVHLLARALPRLRGQPREPVAVQQVPALRAAVVIEH